MNKNKASVTKALMDKLSTWCSNITCLEIRLSDLSSLDAEFPTTLSELRLIKCELRLTQFEKMRFDSLEIIDLTGSSRVCAAHIKDLAKFNASLAKLTLKKCYRIDDKAIESIVECDFVRLDHLDLEETNVTSVGVHLICTRLKDKLVYLNVKSCKHILTSDVDFIRNTFCINNELFKLEQ